MELTKSHDKFFREVFSGRREAAELLRQALPDNIRKNIDFRTLRLDNTSYIDKSLKETFSDLVYDCRYGKKNSIKIAILIEHKSFVPKHPHIQLMKYILNIWEKNIKQKEPLTPVIPLIFYAGKKSWKKREMKEYFNGVDDELLKYLPLFDYLLMDITTYTDEDIKSIFNSLKVQISVLVMKKIFEKIKSFRNFAIVFSGIDERLTGEGGERFLETLMIFLFSNIDIQEDNVEHIVKKISEISNKGGKMAMSIATRLHEQGIQQGLQKGIQQGLQKGIQQGFEQGSQKTKAEDVRSLYLTGKFTKKEIALLLNVNLDFVEEVLADKES